MPSKSSLLILSGLDPCGGAGIVADIQTARDFNIPVRAIATALTVQTSARYDYHETVSPQLVADQLAAVFDEAPPAGIKLGMLPTLAHAQAIARCLETRHWRGPFIWDPILAASSGGEMFPLGEFDAIWTALHPHVSGITPNIPEITRFLGKISPPEHAIGTLYDRLAATPPFFILLKGGHGNEETITDYLYDGQKIEKFSHPRIISAHHPRGTGCRLATALACGLIAREPLAATVQKARQYIMNYLTRA